MHQRLWNERMAEALREREESTEELLRKFEIFMERHGYEKKILASLQVFLFFGFGRGIRFRSEPNCRVRMYC